MFAVTAPGSVPERNDDDFECSWSMAGNWQTLSPVQRSADSISWLNAVLSRPNDVTASSTSASRTTSSLQSRLCALAEPLLADANLDAILSGVTLTPDHVSDVVSGFPDDASLLLALLENVSGGVGSTLHKTDQELGLDATKADTVRRVHRLLTRAILSPAFVTGDCVRLALAAPGTQPIAVILAWVLHERHRRSHGCRSHPDPTCTTCATFLDAYVRFTRAHITPVFSPKMAGALLAICVLVDPVEYVRALEDGPAGGRSAGHLTFCSVERAALWDPYFVAVSKASRSLKRAALGDLVALVDNRQNCTKITTTVPDWHVQPLTLLKAVSAAGDDESVASIHAVVSALLANLFLTTPRFRPALEVVLEFAERKNSVETARVIATKFLQRLAPNRFSSSTHAVEWNNMVDVAELVRDQIFCNAPSFSLSGPFQGVGGFRLTAGGKHDPLDSDLALATTTLLRAIGCYSRSSRLDEKRVGGPGKAAAICDALEDARLLLRIVPIKVKDAGNQHDLVEAIGEFATGMFFPKRMAKALRRAALLPIKHRVPDSLVDEVLDEQGALVPLTVRHLRESIEVTSHVRMFKTYSGWMASTFVNVIVDRGLSARSAVRIGIFLQSAGLVRPVRRQDAVFSNDNELFQFE